MNIRYKNIEINDYEDLYLYPIGDLHIGHMNCDMRFVEETLNNIPNQPNHRIILMGDLIDCGIKTSIGASAYEQTLTPNEQLNKIVEIFRPYREQIDGVVLGNHEYRIMKDSGIDVLEQFCNILDVEYFLYSGTINYTFGRTRNDRRSYSINFFHGKAGGGVENALRACKGMSQKVFADVFLMGHCHYKAYTSRVLKYVTRNKLLKQMQQLFVLTGHSLNYDDSYADQMNLEISPKGFPTICFSGYGEKDIKVS